MSHQQKVLVTGITGFLGAHTAIQLLAKGYNVVGSMRNLQRSSAIDAIIRAQVDAGDRLRYVTADLMRPDDWDLAVQGVDYVLHIASPFPASLPKHEDDLIIPAREGTLHVLRAAAKANVKRTVVTSSTGAVVYGNQKRGTFTEADWTNTANKRDTTPYFRSKTIAEKAAWRFIQQDTSGMELVTIQPGAILGPVLEKDYGTSADIVKKMLDGSIPAIPDIGFAMVDVRSVADLHLRAMESPVAAGQRFIAAGEFLNFTTISSILRAAYPERKIPKRTLPDFMVRLFALFDQKVRPVLLDLKAERKVDNSKAKKLLGWEPLSERQAVLDCAASLIDLKIV